MPVSACPLPAVIPDIDNKVCDRTHDQILNIVFAKVGSGFTDATDYDTKSSWLTRLAASDVTKIQITSFLAEGVVTPGEEILYGGNDNTTVRGVPLTTGEGFTEFSFQFLDQTLEILKQMRPFAALAQAGELAVYLVGDDFSYFSGDTPTSGYLGIPVQGFFIPKFGEFADLTTPNKDMLKLRVAAIEGEKLQFFRHLNFNPTTLDN